MEQAGRHSSKNHGTDGRLGNFMRGEQYTECVAAPPAPFLFDLDGTLADTLADIAASTNHVRSLFGLPTIPVAAVRPLVGDGARQLLARALAERTPTTADLDRALAGYLDHHAGACTATVVPFPGVDAGLRRLALAAHPLAVVTNKPERFARRIVDHLGWRALLPVVVGGDTLPVRKPDPEPLRHALRLLAVPPTGATMVGDGEQDIRAGKACGLRTIGCLYGYRPPEVLRAAAADAYWATFLP